MAEKTVDEEIKISNNLWGKADLAALREQWDSDYKYVYDYESKSIFSSTEQGWENVHYNGASVLINKLLSLLTSSWINLYIPMPEKDKRQREAISKTEQMVMGALVANDRNLTSGYMGKKLQDLIAWNSVVRGGTATLVYCHEKDGKFIPDVRQYDPYNVVSREGRFEYRYYEDTETLRDRYGNDKISGSKDNKTLCREIWRPDKWIVLAESLKVDGDTNHYGYVPARISTCGAVPVIQTDTYTEGLKSAFVSALTNNRPLYDKISQVLSILASRAKDSGRIKIVYPYDSSKSGGTNYDETVEKLGYAQKGKETRNEIIGIDIATGTGTPFIVNPPSDEHLMSYLNILMGLDVIGSIDPIAWGQAKGSSTSGALADTLRNAALEFLNPFKVCIQDTYTFIGEELAKQYKSGDFNKATFRGKDNKREMFYADISPEDITDEEPFECEVVCNNLRNEAQELGNAIQAKQYGLGSTKTLMAKHNLYTNPDREVELMQAEIANQDPIMWYRNQAYASLDEGTEEGKFRAEYYLFMEQDLIRRVMAGEIVPPMIQQMMISKTPNPSTMPQADTGRIASEIR